MRSSRSNIVCWSRLGPILALHRILTCGRISIRFCSEQTHWLDDYALFRALKAHYRGADFVDWHQELVRRKPSALAGARHDLAGDIDKSRFAQFLLFHQGERLKDYAHERGIGGC